MLKWDDNVVITDGTDRPGRISPALQPGYFNIDELLFEQLLAMGADFASQIKYYNLKNKVDGNWGMLLSSDEAVIMSMILSINLEQMESRFLSLLSMRPLLAVDYIVQNARRINFWIVKLKRHGFDVGGALLYKLNGLVTEKLAQELHTVVHLGSMFSSVDDKLDDAIFSEFIALWKIEKKKKSPGLGFSSDETTQDDSESHYLFPLAVVPALASTMEIKRQIRSIFYIFYNAISYLKSLTPVYLQESLGSQMHEPSAGLYMVFLKLFEKSQKIINQFTQRHLDFYYHRVLQGKPRPSIPESAHLQMEVLPGMRGTLIEKGRPFTAGKGEKVDEIIYTANSDLWMCDVQVAGLYTTYLQHDRLIAPESEFGYVTRIKQSDPLSIESSDDDPKAWPLFGEEKKCSDVKTNNDAVLGFSIASPVLLLKEGERRIELSIALGQHEKTTSEATTDTPSCDGEHQASEAGSEIAPDKKLHSEAKTASNDKENFLKRLGAQFSRFLLSAEDEAFNEAYVIDEPQAQQFFDADEIVEIKKRFNNQQENFFKLLENIFTIQLTTEEGWLTIEDYIVTPHAGGGDGSMGLEIGFDVEQEMGAVISYDPAIHGADAETQGGGLDTEFPVLKCYINPQSNFYAYSLFSDLFVKVMDIDVSANGVNDLMLYNNHGQLDPSKPFNPFGPLPGSNSYLIFGNYEMAQKRLVDLKLNLEWGELPIGNGGFNALYSAYDFHYQNSSFKASFEALVDGHWSPRENDPNFNVELFDTHGDEGELKSEKTLDVNAWDYAKPLFFSLGVDDYQYTVGSRGGFFKLSLREPLGAFGHSEYPMLLSSTLTANSKLKIPKPMPNEPYTPVLNRISLTYRARSRIDASSRHNHGNKRKVEKIFHHHPFGVSTAYPNSKDQAPALFPVYDYQSNLYIGLRGKEVRGSVTLFFHLCEDHGQETVGEAERFLWFYLAQDGWKRVEPKRVVRDTTNGFLSSGIITLNLPNDLTNQNPEMPGDLYWLRLSSPTDANGVCSCYAITTNVVPVTRQPQHDVAEQEIASSSASWQPMATIPGIGGVEQVGQLFGGKRHEDEQGFKIRLSEQLRHKNRASTPWDYERLVLDNFSSVAKVKCFSNMRSNRLGPAPGHVLIVVVPHVDEETTAPSSNAMVSSIELSRIREFLLRHTSSFVKLEVRNPVYEQVQIRCTVKFSTTMGDVAWGNRLNRDISNYLSPWRQMGYKSRFGWTIRQKDMESYIRELEYIEYVTNFSMLHITKEGEDIYTLGDTARGRSNSEMIITPRYPWSLPVPSTHHGIETTHVLGGIAAEITGIDELEIGSTFIISGTEEHGQKE